MKLLNTFKHLGLVFFMFFLSAAGSVVFAQNCGSELTVENNRSYQAVTGQGAKYTLLLKNTSSASQSFIIQATPTTSPCDNGTYVNQGVNTLLRPQILDANLVVLPNNTINVSAGQTKKVVVKLTASQSARFNTWGCIDVVALATGCQERTAQVTLSGLVVDPSEK